MALLSPTPHREHCDNYIIISSEPDPDQVGSVIIRLHGSEAGFVIGFQDLEIINCGS